MGEGGRNSTSKEVTTMTQKKTFTLLSNNRKRKTCGSSLILSPGSGTVGRTHSKSVHSGYAGHC